MIERADIGKFLYQERKKRHLSQKEFLNGVLSVSQYSRVENGEQDLRTVDFMKIIQFNRINVDDLLKQNKNMSNNIAEDEELNELATAFYDQDLDRIKIIKKKAESDDASSNVVLDAIVMESILEDKLDVLDSKTIEKFSKRLDESDNWTTDKRFLQLFGSSMMIFSKDRLNIYMKKIIKSFGNEIGKSPFEIQRRIGAVCINYLGRTYKDKDRSQLSSVLLIIYNMSPIPDLLMYKLLGQYFEALFIGNRGKANELIGVLSECGYEKFIVNLPR